MSFRGLHVLVRRCVSHWRSWRGWLSCGHGDRHGEHCRRAQHLIETRQAKIVFLQSNNDRPGVSIQPGKHSRSSQNWADSLIFFFLCYTRRRCAPLVSRATIVCGVGKAHFFFFGFYSNPIDCFAPNIIRVFFSS